MHTFALFDNARQIISTLPEHSGSFRKFSHCIARSCLQITGRRRKRDRRRWIYGALPLTACVQHNAFIFFFCTFFCSLTRCSFAPMGGSQRVFLNEFPRRRNSLVRETWDVDSILTNEIHHQEQTQLSVFSTSDSLLTIILILRYMGCKIHSYPIALVIDWIHRIKLFQMQHN